MKIYLIKRSAVVYALLFTSMQIFCTEAEQTAQPAPEQAAPTAGSTRGSLSWAAHQVYGPYRELGSKAWQAGQWASSKASTGAKAAYERAKAAVPTIPLSARDIGLATAGGIVAADLAAGFTTGPIAPAAGKRFFEATGLTPSADLGMYTALGITTGLLGARMYQLYRQRMNDKKDANSLVADIQSAYEAINENDNQAFLTTVYDNAIKTAAGNKKDDIFKNFIGILDADVASLSKITRSHIVINPNLKEQIKALIIKLNRIKELVSARALEALAVNIALAEKKQQLPRRSRPTEEEHISQE